ncbi:MAG: rod shape-determining protein MreD [Lachnospiraceae bacterium]
MKRIIITAVIILSAFLLQTTVFQWIPYIETVPNLLLIITFSIGFMRGRKEGMAVGFVCGLLLDLFYGDILGFYTLAFVYIGYFNGILSKFLVTDIVLLPMGLCLFSGLLYNLYIYIFGFLIRRRLDFISYVNTVILPEIILTLLATILLYGILLIINRKLEEYEKKGATKFA